MVAFPDGIDKIQADLLIDSPNLSPHGQSFMDLVHHNYLNWKKQEDDVDDHKPGQPPVHYDCHLPSDTPETIVLRTLQWILQSGQAVSAEAMGDVIVNDLRVAGWLPPLED